MRLQQEWEANEARKAYAAAIATFKKNPPTILREKRVHFETSRGKTSYMHATLGDVTQPIIEGPRSESRTGGTWSSPTAA